MREKAILFVFFPLNLSPPCVCVCDVFEDERTPPPLSSSFYSLLPIRLDSHSSHLEEPPINAEQHLGAVEVLTRQGSCRGPRAQPRARQSARARRSHPRMPAECVVNIMIKSYATSLFVPNSSTSLSSSSPDRFDVIKVRASLHVARKSVVPHTSQSVRTRISLWMLPRATARRREMADDVKAPTQVMRERGFEGCQCFSFAGNIFAKCG